MPREQKSSAGCPTAASSGSSGNSHNAPVLGFSLNILLFCCDSKLAQSLRGVEGIVSHGRHLSFEMGLPSKPNPPMACHDTASSPFRVVMPTTRESNGMQSKYWTVTGCRCLLCIDNDEEEDEVYMGGWTGISTTHCSHSV